MLCWRVPADQRQSGAVSVAGCMRRRTDSGIQRGEKLGRAGGEKEARVLSKVVDVPATGSVGGQMGTRVRMAGRPVTLPVVAAGDVRHERCGDGVLVCGLVPVSDQVLAEGPVIEP